jgi:hypothetical protein
MLRDWELCSTSRDQQAAVFEISKKHINPQREGFENSIFVTAFCGTVNFGKL